MYSVGTGLCFDKFSHGRFGVSIGQRHRSSVFLGIYIHNCTKERTNFFSSNVSKAMHK